MRKLWTFIVFLSCFSCNVNKSDKKETKKIGAFNVYANFIDDTTIDGVADFYGPDKILTERRSYTKGIKHGICYNYFPNGVVHEKTFYNYDKKSGFHEVYDSTGQLNYKDYFLEGKQIGPIINYNSGGKIKDYYFVDFEGNTLYYAEYDSLGKVAKTEGELIHIAVTDVLTNATKQLNLFIYTPNPPELDFSYSVELMDKSGKLSGTPISLDTGNVYVEKILPLPPKEKKYCIILNFLEHKTGKKTVAIREIFL
jgi:antitoxin component YwqK of YwqJK toxin-antitoxin module